MAKTTIVKRLVRKNFAELQDGTLVEVKTITNPDAYNKSVTIYENKLAKGAKAGQSEFAVAVNDHVPSRTPAVDSLLVQFDKGEVTAEQVVAEMKARADARLAKKQAKA